VPFWWRLCNIVEALPLLEPVHSTFLLEVLLLHIITCRYHCLLLWILLRFDGWRYCDTNFVYSAILFYCWNYIGG